MKNIGNMIKLGLILAVFATAACVMLAFVYTGTAPQIERRRLIDLEDAQKNVFPDADVFVATEGIASADDSVIIASAYLADRGGIPVGATLEVVSRRGYGGPITMMVGVGSDGLITGVRIMEHSETPGLGANAVSHSFLNQFINKSANDAFEVKNDVNAITAATITSRAVARAVKAAGVATLARFGSAGGVQ